MALKTLALAALAATIVASPVAAAVTTGTFAAGLSSVTSSTFGIQTGTSFTNAGAIVLGRTGDFTAVPNFATFTLGAFTASNGSTISFTGSFGSFSGAIQGLAAVGSPNASINFDAVGLFTPAGVLGGFTPGLASLTAAFTQTGELVEGEPQPAISGSFTFSTPPTVPGVPEPAAWAMLIAGFGLTGAAMRRRRTTVAA